MNAVFLDTVGLLAVWNRSDQWHAPAKWAFERLAAAERVLTTTTFVLLECGNAATRQPFRREVSSLRHQLESAGLLVTPTDADWQAAWAAYDRAEAAQAGIVDCVSFAVMRRLGITEAFTHDRHYAAAGFSMLF
jgi:predicted nucleic acid-binding protein